jgi:hypothetical protein
MVCSVAARDVRPFWGRAALFLGCSLAGLALLAWLSVFAVFRAIGYQVPLYAVAWPPAWHRIHEARADYFYRMAQRAFEAHDVRRTFLALSEVYVLDPENRNAARLLAQFTQIANPDYSDQIYLRLLSRHGKEYEETAQAWFRALLARGDFRSMGVLCARMLREGAGHVPAWTEGLLFAEAMGGDPGEIDRLLAGPKPIPGEARATLSLDQRTRGTAIADQAGALIQSIGIQSTPFEIYFALARLIDIGRASEALQILQASMASSLSPYDREAFKLDCYSLLGWRTLETREIELLFQTGASANATDLVSAHLVRRPDAEISTRVFVLLDASPLAPTAENTSAHMALVCMAGVNGLNARMKEEAGALDRTFGGPFAATGRIQEFFESDAPGKKPAVFLPATPQLPLDTTYALVSHYHVAGKPQADTHGAGAQQDTPSPSRP